MSTSFPIQRSIRRQEIVAAEGQTLFAPTEFKVWDVRDIRVRTKKPGGYFKTRPTGTYLATLVGDAPNFIELTLGVPCIAGEIVRVEGARVPERVTDVTLAGTLRGAALETELDKVSATQQEARRDFDETSEKLDVIDATRDRIEILAPAAEEAIAALDGIEVKAAEVETNRGLVANDAAAASSARSAAQNAATTAVARATTATEQAAIATTQASAATNAVATGRVRRDLVAQLNAALNFPAGAQGEVTGDTAINNGLYEKIGAVGAGSWVKLSDWTIPALGTTLQERTADLPNTFIMSADVFDEEGKQLVAGIADSTGRVAFYVTQDASVVSGKLSFEFQEIEDTTIVQAYTDKSWRSWLNVYSDGSVSFPGGVRGLSGSSGGTATATPTPQVLPSLAFRLLYGQSLATGTTGIPPLTVTATYGTLMYAGGIRLLNNADLTSFVPAVETKDSALGETGAAASAAQSVAYHLALDGGTWQDRGSDYFVASGGRGGAELSRLAKGSSYYTGMMTIASGAIPLAAAAGRTFGLTCIEMIHGQADQAFGRTRLSYATGCVKLRKDIEADHKALTGQSGVVPMVMVQSGCHAAYYLRRASDTGEVSYPAAHATPEIDLAMMDAATADPNILVVMSLYSVNLPDGIHSDNEGYRHAGKMRGRAAAKIERALSSGVAYPVVAVRPLSYIAQKRSIRIKMSVPYGPLVFDATWVAQAPNQGFDIWDVSGAGYSRVDIISSIAIVGKDTVEIKLSSDLPLLWACTYAWGRNTSSTGGRTDGPRGNLRDSEGDSPTGGNTYVDSAGTTRRMDNYGLLFLLTNKV